MQVEMAGPKNSARISAAGNSLIVFVSEQNKNTMKKPIFVFISLMEIFAGCQIESINEPSRLDKSTVYEASTEVFTPQTKTSMTSDKQVVWSQNDRLAIFQGCTVADEFLVTDSSDGKTSADFNIVSDNSEVNGSFSAGTEVPCNVAFYPYAENLSLSGASIDGGTAYEIEGVVLPKVQNNVAGSFANGAFPMIAVTETLSDHTLRFKNVLGAIKLQLKGTQKVASITLKGKNNEKLSGAAVVTASTDETKPAITMASSASTSVTLNCGSGVQLNESKATEFIISLPPVLFSKGFTVTVTDTESNTYTVETDKANIVLRSSLLVMPDFKLDASSEDDSDIIPVVKVTVSKTNLTLTTRFSYALTAKITPIDATDQSIVWSSDNASVVTVDQSGVLTTLSSGTAVITAEAGGVTGTCTIKVIAPTTREVKDYEVDGISYGKGIVIGDVIWAPVNCGYEPTTYDSKGYPYGKLYQWGRKYGQGYTTIYDASEPEIVEGPIPAINGQKDIYSYTFFIASESPYDWTSPQKDDLWNSGTEDNPVKTEYDPCPEGWRVPTYAELAHLTNSYSSFMTVGDQKGRYFCGDYTYLDNAPQVFFPAAGYRDNGDGYVTFRGGDGLYWSSRPGNNHGYYGAYSLFFYRGSASMDSGSNRASGYSVRCVQE